MIVRLNIDCEYEILFEPKDTDEDKVRKIEERLEEERKIMKTSKELFMGSKRFKGKKFEYKIEQKK